MTDTHDSSDPLRITTGDRSLAIRLSPRGFVAVRREAGRCTVRLGFGSKGVGPDVSVQPSAVAEVIDEHAQFAGVDPNRWRTAIVRSIEAWEPSLAWCAGAPEMVEAAFGALTHPLLAPLYEQGAAALGDIPRWASPVLQAASAADAARVVTGERTTRRLTRALAVSLAARPGRVDLGSLSLAVAAGGQTTADQLANLLEAGAAADAAEPLTVDQVRVVRSHLGAWPPDRRARLLVSAAADLGRFAAAMTRFAWVVQRAPRPLPVSVADLTALCTRLVPVLPEPRPAVDPSAPARRAVRQHDRTHPPVGRRVAVPEALAEIVHPTDPVMTAPPPAAPPRRPRQQGRQPLPPPPVAPRPHPDRWPVPAALRPVSGHRVGELTFCVPTSEAELVWWSQQLNNCLDTYGPAVVRGRSWLVGIRDGDDLVGCVEIDPVGRGLRQAQGFGNRALPQQAYDTTIQVLGRFGILRIHR